MRPRCARADPCAEQFVEFYYKTFDANRSQLASLYGPDSMLTFEAAPLSGAANIVQKLVVWTCMYARGSEWSATDG